MAQLEVVRTGKNFILYKGGIIKLENVRLSYPHLDKPYAGRNEDGSSQGKPKFGVVAMLPKETHVEAKNVCMEELNRILGENKSSGGEVPKIAADKRFIRNGDDSDKKAYANHWTVSAREDRRPGCRDRDGSLITDESRIADKFYGGCWGNVLIRVWYQDGVKVGKGFGKRMNAGLMGVQFIKDDDPFGEGRIDDTAAWGSEGSGGGDGMDDDDGL